MVFKPLPLPQLHTESIACNGFAMIAVSVFVALFAASVTALDNGVGRTPAMGWNSWNTFHSSVSSELLKETADIFVSLGLDKAGYKYVNTDDCWSNLERDSTGHIVPASNFPGGTAGMQNLSAYIRSRGLKFGIYGAAGLTTCAGRAGSLYHERLDAATFAEWGAEYLKFDECGENTLQSYAKFSIMRDSLNATGKHIFFSYEPHIDVPIAWTIQVGNSWRSGNDISPRFSSIMSNVINNNLWSGVGRPGAFPSADMLEVGVPGLSLGESRVHFALWCLVKSPLLIGADLRSIQTPFLDILRNADLISISQDPLGVVGALVASSAAPASPGSAAELPAKQRLSESQVGIPRALQDAPALTPRALQDAPALTSRALQGASALTQARSSQELVTDCDITDGSHVAIASQQWVVDVAAGTVQQGGKCLAVDYNGTWSGPPAVGLADCDPSSQLQQWRGLETVNITVAPIVFATNVSSGTAVWFQGPTQGVAEPSASNRRCGTCCGANDTTSPICHNTTDDGKLYISKDEMIARCAADTRCAGFSLDTTEGNYFRPVTVISSIEDTWSVDDEKWLTWQSHTGPSPTGWCLAVNETNSLFLEACEVEPALCYVSRCYTSRLVRQLWYHAKSSQLLSSFTSSPVSPLRSPLASAPGPEPVNIPKCLATEANPNPPQPPPAPPAVDSTLPLQVWAGPLSDNRVAAVLVNVGTTNATISASWSDLGLAPGTVVAVRDAMNGKDLGTSSGPLSAQVPTHDAAAFILTPQ